MSCAVGSNSRLGVAANWEASPDRILHGVLMVISDFCIQGEFLFNFQCFILTGESNILEVSKQSL